MFIQHAVWLYRCFSLGLGDVELILAARGVVASHGSIREQRAALRLAICQRIEAVSARAEQQTAHG